VNPTPLELAPESLAPGRKLFLKREDVHELGAFKWRGALPTLEEYREDGAKTVDRKPRRCDGLGGGEARAARDRLRARVGES